MLVGRSAVMQDLRVRVARVAKTNFTVLIEGESGAGKELVAHELHLHSARARGPFVAVNCAALVETLVEAELFGIEERTATGVRGRRGKFEQADQGTLFLDEVGGSVADGAGQAAARASRPVDRACWRPVHAASRRASRRQRPTAVSPASCRRDDSAPISTTGWLASRYTCRRCARAGATSRCSSITSSPDTAGRDRCRSRFGQSRRW